MIPVVDPEVMRTIDAAAPDPIDVLVDRAGSAVARTALRMLGGSYGRRVVVIAGPGNNGADGRIAAVRLRERGVHVVVHDVGEVPDAIRGADLVIDAAFGSGFRGCWSPPAVGASPVLAVDVPSGLDARTGQVSGESVRADVTVTFAALRPGHLLGHGPDRCGEVVVADIGLDTTGVGVVGPTGRPPSVSMSLAERSDVVDWLPRRGRSAHKWSSAVRLVAGSPGMTGAARLAASAAQRAGAGMVVMSSPATSGSAPVEAVERPLATTGWAETVLEDIERFRALVIGPGLGRDEVTLRTVAQVVAAAPVAVVVDGDGLAAFARTRSTGSLIDVEQVLVDRAVPAVLTPHDGEFALLTGAPPGADRIDAASDLADRTGAVVLLKGPTTIVAGPGGPVWFVDRGDQRLATAGSGDVLAGIIGALLAQGLDPLRSAVAGAWIHGEAGRRSSPRGLVASDLVDALPAVFSSLDGGATPSGCSSS